MRKAQLILLFLVLSALAVLVRPAAAQSRDFDPTTVPVQLMKFELHGAQDSAPGLTPGAKPKPADTLDKPKRDNVIYQLDDKPSDQARLIEDFFTATLQKILQDRGYRVAVGGSRPSNGALIKAVFAEPGPSNNIRRATHGAGAPAARYMVYVGIFNAANADQPLYQLAPVQSNDPRYGPVITLNAYIPLAKYEVSKAPTEEQVRTVCYNIAADLARLLASNAATFSH